MSRTMHNVARRWGRWALVAAVAVSLCLIWTGCDKMDKGAVKSVAKKVAPAEVSNNPKNKEVPLDYLALPADFPAAMAKIQTSLKWSKHQGSMFKEVPADAPSAFPYVERKIDRKILKESFDLGAAFLLKNQLPEGNFNYMYDWLAKSFVDDDNQVRQAGALWGLALCYQYNPQPDMRAGLEKGLRFWFGQTIPGPEGSLTVKYKADRGTATGTVALIALTIVDFLSVGDKLPADFQKELNEKLDGYLKFLVWMQRNNGHFADTYMVDTGKRRERSSPYYDGETLLCLCKAARFAGRDWLVPVIERAARAMVETYTIQQWKQDVDSATTKGFYQWGSMSFAEYYEAKWSNYELFGDATLVLGWWMTHTHETLKRGRNHAYALEGLISAYRIARARKNIPAMVDLLYNIDRSLYKLTSWQIHGPLADQNPFLQANPTDDPFAHGGVMNSARKHKQQAPGDTQEELRIDVTQHQMHAVTMALEYVYDEETAAEPPAAN